MSRYLVLALSLILFPLAAQASVWIVDQGGGGDFATIADAINAAASGDEIHVHAGTYFENISYLGKDLHLLGLGGPAATIIDGSTGTPENGSCVSFRAGETSAAVLEGFTLTGGFGTDYAGQTRGGAIVCEFASPTIEDCRFVENQAHYAGAIFLDTAAPQLLSCEFLSNQANSYGGAIAGPNATPTVSACHFEDNAAYVGDGTIHLTAGATIEDCVFRDNQARAGAAINCANAGADAVIRRCHFFGNHATGLHGGAIRLHEAVCYVEDCLFAANWALLDGGAIVLLDGAGLQMQSCTLYQNAASRFGGHLTSYGSSLLVENSVFSEATAGGGLHVYDGVASFFCCDVWGNAGGDYVGIPDPTGTDGNLSTDPLFCDPGQEDFYLQSASPCADENNPECGQIGAFEIGCEGPVPVKQVSWGELKERFGRAR